MHHCRKPKRSAYVGSGGRLRTVGVEQTLPLCRTSWHEPRPSRRAGITSLRMARSRAYILCGRTRSCMCTAGNSAASIATPSMRFSDHVPARSVSRTWPTFPAAATRSLPIHGSSTYYTQTTWRELLLTTGRTAHVNNLGSLLRCFEEVRSVSFRVYQGSFDEYNAQVARGRLPGAGFSDNLINEIRWEGVSLDSQVTVKYGAWVRKTFEAKNLVSLNADVIFRLRSDYAKSFWPFNRLAAELHLRRRQYSGRSGWTRLPQ